MDKNAPAEADADSGKQRTPKRKKTTGNDLLQKVKEAGETFVNAY